MGVRKQNEKQENIEGSGRAREKAGGCRRDWENNRKGRRMLRGMGKQQESQKGVRGGEDRSENSIVSLGIN